MCAQIVVDSYDCVSPSSLLSRAFLVDPGIQASSHDAEREVYNGKEDQFIVMKSTWVVLCVDCYLLVDPSVQVRRKRGVQMKKRNPGAMVRALIKN